MIEMPPRGRTLTALAVLVGIALSASSEGAVVLLKSQEEPLYALIVEERPDQVTLDVDGGTGTLTRRVVRRDDIAEILPTVSPERLESLSPDTPADYRTYAEELAEKKSDPEARAVAEHLFLLAARLAPADEGRASLLGLARLVPGDRAPAVRAVAFVLDPRHDRSVLTPDVSSPATTVAGSDPDSRRRAVDLIRRIRYGDTATAKKLWSDAAIRDRITSTVAAFPVDLAEDYLQRGGALKTELMLALLQAERVLRRGAGGASATAAARPDGDPVPALAGGAPPVPVLSLEALSAYDLSKTVYRGGAWVRP